MKMKAGFPHSLKGILLFLVTIAALLLSACGGGGSGGGGTPASPQTEVTGQALLGPLAGSLVDVYRYDDLTRAIHSTTTSDDGTLSGTGLFTIPVSVLDDDMLYVVHITGGMDIDADDDGVIDPTPTENLGTLHLVATGSQMKAGEFKANILTDIVYYNVHYLLMTGASQTTIENEIGLYARAVLKDDIDGDGAKTPYDLLDWHPATGKEKLSKDWSYFSECIEATRNNATHEGKRWGFMPHSTGSMVQKTNTGILEVAGDYAYVSLFDETTFQSTLQIIDTSNRDTPSPAGTYNPNDYIEDVAVKENYAYVLTGRKGLQVVNTGTPNRPSLVGSVETDGYELAISASEKFVYIANYDDFTAVDITNPKSPKIAGNIRLQAQGDIKDFVVQNNYAYVITGGEGNPNALYVIDLSAPAPPRIDNILELSNEPYFISSSGNRVFVAEGSNGIEVIDITAPSKPMSKGITDINVQSKTFFVENDIVYLYNGSGLKAINMADLEQPSLINSFYFGQYATMNVSEGFIYLMNDVVGLQIIDMATLLKDMPLASTHLPITALGIDVAENHAFIASGDTGLQVLDISNPSFPAVSAVCQIPGSAASLTVSDGYAYIAANEAGLQIVDIQTPATPQLISGIQTNGSANTLAVAEGFAYVVCPDQGLSIVNVSEPTMPTITSSTPIQRPVEIALSDNFLYISTLSSNYSNGDYLQCGIILDVSNPAEPEFIDTFQSFQTFELKAYKNMLFTADVLFGMSVMDISHPGEATRIGGVSRNFITSCNSIAINGNLTYISKMGHNIEIVDILMPESPVIVSAFRGRYQGIGGKLAASNDLLFVAYGSKGLSIYPALPKVE